MRWTIGVLLVALASAASAEETTLDLSRQPIADAALAERLRRAASTPIHTLKLTYCDRLTDRALEHIGRLTPLRRLDLRGCTGLTDDGLAALAGLRLRELNLDETRLGDDALDALRNMRSLAVLRVKRSRVGDAGMVSLARLDKLWQLDLEESPLTDAGLARIARLRSLQSLDLEDCDHITDAGLRVLAGRRPPLHMSVRGRQITEAGVQALAGLLRGSEITIRRRFSVPLPTHTLHRADPSRPPDPALLAFGAFALRMDAAAVSRLVAAQAWSCEPATPVDGDVRVQAGADRVWLTLRGGRVARLRLRFATPGASRTALRSRYAEYCYVPSRKATGPGRWVMADEGRHVLVEVDEEGRTLSAIDAAAVDAKEAGRRFMELWPNWR